MPFQNQPYTVSASLALQGYRRRVAFVFPIDWEME